MNNNRITALEWTARSLGHREAEIHFNDQIFALDSVVVKIQNGLAGIEDSLIFRHQHRETIRSN